MKVVDLSDNYDAEYKKRVLNEPEILKNIQHPNIVKFVDNFVLDKKCYQVCTIMEYIEGKTLESLIQKNKN